VTVDWDLVVSYAIGGLISTTIMSLATFGGVLILRRWLKNSQFGAVLAQLPGAMAAMAAVVPATPSPDAWERAVAACGPDDPVPSPLTVDQRDVVSGTLNVRERSSSFLDGDSPFQSTLGK
jgi:hypothetical protein